MDPGTPGRGEVRTGGRTLLGLPAALGEQELQQGYVSPLALIGSFPESRDHTGPGITPEIDPRALIDAFATVDAGTERATRVGASWLFKHTHVGHDCIIGDGCEISTGTVIGGWVEIGDNVRVGINATIRPRVKVGDGAMIGMGAVVTKDVPAGETWIGCPARRMREPMPDNLWQEWYDEWHRAVA